MSSVCVFFSLSGECLIRREGASERDGSDEERVQHAWPQHTAQRFHTAK